MTEWLDNYGECILKVMLGMILAGGVVFMWTLVFAFIKMVSHVP